MATWEQIKAYLQNPDIAAKELSSNIDHSKDDLAASDTELMEKIDPEHKPRDLAKSKEDIDQAMDAGMMSGGIKSWHSPDSALARLAEGFKNNNLHPETDGNKIQRYMEGANNVVVRPPVPNSLTPGEVSLKSPPTDFEKAMRQSHYGKMDKLVDDFKAMQNSERTQKDMSEVQRVKDLNPHDVTDPMIMSDQLPVDQESLLAALKKIRGY